MDRWKPNLAKVMTILTPDEDTKSIAIALRVSTAHYGEIVAFVLFFYFLNIMHSPNASVDFDG
jgi:hypothetical protein